MNTLENTQKISLLFFAVLGLTNIVSGLMAAQNLHLNTSATIYNVSDIPFALSAVLYAGTSLKLSLASGEKNNTMLNAALILGTIIILSALIYINFLIPDLNGQ